MAVSTDKSVEVTSTPASTSQPSLPRTRCGGGAIGSMSSGGGSSSSGNCNLHLVLPTLIALCGLTEARQLLKALVQSVASLKHNLKVNNPIARWSHDGRASGGTRGRAYRVLLIGNSSGVSAAGRTTAARFSGSIVVKRCCSWWWWKSWRRSCGRGSSCGWKKKKRRRSVSLLPYKPRARIHANDNSQWTIETVALRR